MTFASSARLVDSEHDPADRTVVEHAAGSRLDRHQVRRAQPPAGQRFGPAELGAEQPRAHAGAPVVARRPRRRPGQEVGRSRADHALVRGPCRQGAGEGRRPDPASRPTRSAHAISEVVEFGDQALRRSDRGHAPHGRLDQDASSRITRAELKKGVLDMPQEAKESTTAIRRAVSEQINALKELSDIVAKSGRTRRVDVRSAPRAAARLRGRRPPRRAVSAARTAPRRSAAVRRGAAARQPTPAAR